MKAKMKRKVITVEVETSVSNQDIKKHFKREDEIWIESEKFMTIKQVQVNNIEAKK